MSFLFLLFSWGYSSVEGISSQNLHSEFQELKSKEKDFYKLEGLLKEWEEIGKFYSRFKQDFLMKFDEFPNFRNDLEKIFKENNLDSSQLNFKIQNLRDNILRVSIVFGLSGTYKNIKKFFFDIENNPHLIFLNDAKLSKSKSEITGKFSMEVYFVR